MTLKWQHGVLSNYDYLLYINRQAVAYFYFLLLWICFQAFWMAKVKKFVGIFLGCIPLSGVFQLLFPTLFLYIYIFFGGGFVFFVLYSTLLHLPPLRFHCADGCWDRTQDSCNWCIGSQTPTIARLSQLPLIKDTKIIVDSGVSIKSYSYPEEVVMIFFYGCTTLKC